MATHLAEGRNSRNQTGTVRQGFKDDTETRESDTKGYSAGSRKGRIQRRLLDIGENHQPHQKEDRGRIQRTLGMAYSRTLWLLLSGTPEESEGERRENHQYLGQENLAEGKKGGIKNKAIFGFFDESGVSDKPPVVTTWGKKGCTPVVKSAGGWKNLTLLGMTTYEPTQRKADSLVWIQKKSVRQDSILRLLNDLKKKYEHCGHPLLLVWDGLPPHRAKSVRHWIKKNKTWLSVHRLPSYAPELNPQEYAWSSLKRKTLGNYCPPTLWALAQKARRGMRKMRETSILKGFLKKSGLWNEKELGEGQ